MPEYLAIKRDLAEPDLLRLKWREMPQKIVRVMSATGG